VSWKLSPCMLHSQLTSIKFQSHAPPGHTIFRHRAWCGHSQNSRTRSQRANETRRLVPAMFLYNHGGIYTIPSIIISLLILLQGRDVDLLLGLDMLKAHQACIDLEKNVLRIQGREVPFLSEHELPDKARDPLEPSVEATTSSGPSLSTPRSASTPAPAAFPGGGRTIGSAPAGGGAGAPTTNTPPRPQRTSPSEQSIRLLMDLGATRELAISTLEAAGGNVDVAASLLF